MKKTEKINFTKIKGTMSREEMKAIMAGSMAGYCPTGTQWCASGNACLEPYEWSQRHCTFP
jgi:hypothetical protein